MNLFTDPYLAQHWVVFSSLLGIIGGFYMMAQTNSVLLSRRNNVSVFGWVLVFFITVWLGSRPLWAYVDTGGYTLIFNMVQRGELPAIPREDSSEWLFTAIEYLCIDIADASTWLLVIASFYVGCMALAIKGWFPNNFSVAIIFAVTSFSFFAYGANGIRNGMATSIALLGLLYLSKHADRIKFMQIAVGLVILYLSTAIHQSCLLIIASAVCALYYKNTKTYVIIWVICICLSLIAGETVKSLVASFISDDRASYIISTPDERYFSRTGFRWDFILYSSVPILLGLYTLKKNISREATYCFLLNTYIIANSFWCLINSTANSNRFAYLSWFLMPVVVAYPLLKIPVFKNQGMVCGLFLLGGVIFNLIF